MRHPYYETVLLIERAHRHFLEVVKADLDQLGIQDINNIQALILYNVGQDEMTVGELTVRGYYLGSNVSYNVKKMVEGVHGGTFTLETVAGGARATIELPRKQPRWGAA